MLGGVAGVVLGQGGPNNASGVTLDYDVEANVGGRIAQMGSRLIDGVAKSMADRFFANFAEAVKPKT